MQAASAVEPAATEISRTDRHLLFISVLLAAIAVPVGAALLAACSTTPAGNEAPSQACDTSPSPRNGQPGVDRYAVDRSVSIREPASTSVIFSGSPVDKVGSQTSYVPRIEDTSRC